MQNERKPLYMQIQQHFKDLILSGKLREADKIPSEKELMEQFDVSRITVANALIQLAKEGWIYRIPGRGSFVSEEVSELVSHQNRQGGAARLNPAESSHTLSQIGSAHGVNGDELLIASGQTEGDQGTKTIGLVMPQLVDYFAIRLLQGINSVIENSPYHLQIVLTYNSIDREKAAIKDLIRKGASGLIIFPSDAEMYNEDILSLKLRGFPFVLIDRYLPGVATNVARSDGMVGSQLAVDYLWGLGHRDIAICSDSPLPTITVEDRINGYMEAMKQKEAMINPALILTDFAVDYKEIDKKHPLYRFIKNQIGTAYITLNGRLGLHIYSICKELGLRVPEDISILTFDDPSPGLHEWGFFSHISQSEMEMGEAATQILLDLLEGGDSREQGYTRVILQPKLIESQSTGPHVSNK